MNPLFPILDAALADTTQRSGAWLACRPGCHPCCIGVFPISLLDAAELRTALDSAGPAVAARIRARAAASRVRLTPNFPGDPTTGHLFTQPHHEDAFEDFANDEPCPVLDPATGTCDLYAARPVPCRTFGPPVREFTADAGCPGSGPFTADTGCPGSGPSDPGPHQTPADSQASHLTVCELCFVNAPPEEVARCEMDQSWRPLEADLIAPLGPHQTLIAFALTHPLPQTLSSRPERSAVERPAV